MKIVAEKSLIFSLFLWYLQRLLSVDPSLNIFQFNQILGLIRAHFKVCIVEDTCKQTNHGNILLQVKISREKFQRVQIFASTNFSEWPNHKRFRGTKFIKWSINCKFAGLIFASDPEPREISSRVNFYQQSIKYMLLASLCFALRCSNRCERSRHW